MSTIKTLIKTFPTNQINDLYAILSKLTKKSKEELLATPELALTPSQKKSLTILLQKYGSKEPLAYILGYKYFYNSKFAVNKNTLIPRPETEIIVEMLLKIFGDQARHSLTMLEIATGSGCIPVSILKEIEEHPASYPTLKILATDISKKALEVAEKNARQILTRDSQLKIRFSHSDILSKKNKDKFDFIVSNPPYITPEEYKNLDRSVHDYEPRIALEAGEAGLEVFRKILEKTRRNIKHNTLFLFEINPSTLEGLEKLVKSYYPQADIKILADQYKRKRFLSFKPGKIIH
ncbi:peptide chain release factor N(5)-glutamine methyltransferase [Candidatus Dojkabacteria bacterium]|nr:peptide chain release factor N(5)-glutamine methyltransferase [Candidatus Dojkabacteria bacterium]